MNLKIHKRKKFNLAKKAKDSFMKKVNVFYYYYECVYVDISVASKHNVDIKTIVKRKKITSSSSQS